MAKDMLLQPYLSPTMVKLQSSEFAKIWDSASHYLSQQLCLHQAVHIPGLGTFAVVRKRVASKEKDLVVVERPVFHLSKSNARDHDLRYVCTDVPGHQHCEQLPYAQIASDNAVSESTVQLCLQRSICLFHACLENRKNVALIWRHVGMLIIQRKDVKMTFYIDFLKRLNGTEKMLQALLEMPEMRDLVISRQDTAASQTSSGHVIILPGCKLETMPNMPAGKAGLTGHVKAALEQHWRKGDGGGEKEDLAEKRLLCRARLSPNQLPAITVKSEQGQKAEGTEPHGRQLPTIQPCSLKEKEEKEKLIPLAKPRMVDFIAINKEKREKNKHWKKQLPEHIQKHLAEEKKKAELAEKEKRKQRTVPVTKAKAKTKMKTEKSQKSSSSEQPSVSPLTSVEMEEFTSPDLLEIMMKDCEETVEEHLTVHKDDTVPPKRSLSPRTHQTLLEVVTCILAKVTRERRRQRDDQRDLQDKLRCELAVLRWRRLGKEAHSGQQLEEAGPQPAPPTGPEKKREELEPFRVEPLGSAGSSHPPPGKRDEPMAVMLRSSPPAPRSRSSLHLQVPEEPLGCQGCRERHPARASSTTMSACAGQSGC